MKILVLSNTPLLAHLGAGYVVKGFTEGLAKFGHQVWVFEPDDYTLFPLIKKGKAWLMAFGLYFNALKWINKYDPDVVEFYGGQAWLATWLLSKKSNKRFVLVQHSNGIEPIAEMALKSGGLIPTWNGKPLHWYQKLFRPRIEYAFKYADAIVTVSDAERDGAIHHRYLCPHKILSIPNALSSEFIGCKFSNDRDSIIGFCGSWLERKGIGLISIILPRVLRLNPNWRFQIIGTDSDFNVLNYFPLDVVSQIEIIGKINDKTELINHYCRWSIGIMPSLYESFGLVAAEMMACGVPLISTRTGYACSLKEGEAVVIKYEEDSLFNAIIGLICDPCARRAIANSGCARVQELNWSKSMHAINQFYCARLSFG